MISTISKGNGFRGCLSYTFGKEDALYLGGNMDGENASELTGEFGAVRALRQDVTVPVFHVSLSLPPGEDIQDDKALVVGEDYLKRMGFDPEKNQWAMIRHNDTKHNHFHIIANRVSIDGGYWSDAQDYHKSQEVCRELEKEYQLAAVQSYGRKPGQQRTKQDRSEQERLGLNEHPKQTVAQRIDAAVEASDGTREDFARKLRESGVEARFSYSREGKIYGVSYRLEEGHEGLACKYSGKQVGGGYEWKGLASRLEQQAHQVEALREHAQQSAAMAARIEAGQKEVQAYAEIVSRPEKGREAVAEKGRQLQEIGHTLEAKGREIEQARDRQIEAKEAQLAKIEAATQAKKAEAVEVLANKAAEQGKQFSMEELRARFEAYLEQNQARTAAAEKAPQEVAREVERKPEPEAAREVRDRDLGEAVAGEGREAHRIMDEAFREGHVNDGREEARLESLTNQVEQQAAARDAQQEAQRTQPKPKVQQQEAAPVFPPAMDAGANQEPTKRQEVETPKQSTGSGLKLELERAHASDDKEAGRDPGQGENQARTVGDLDRLTQLAKERQELHGQMLAAREAQTELNALRQEEGPEKIKDQLAEAERNLEEWRKNAPKPQRGIRGIKNKEEIEKYNKQTLEKEKQAELLRVRLEKAREREPWRQSRIKELEPKTWNTIAGSNTEQQNINRESLAREYAACVKHHGKDVTDAHVEKTMDQKTQEIMRGAYSKLLSQQAALERQKARAQSRGQETVIVKKVIIER